MAIDLGAFVSTGSLWKTGEFWDNWYVLSALAMIASVMVLSFIYLLGILFRNQSLNDFVKLEIFETLSTAVIIMLVFFFVAIFASLKVSDVLPNALLPEDPDSSTNIAQASIYTACQKYFEAVGKDMNMWLELNYLLNIIMDMLASVTPYSRPLGVGLVASPLAGFASPIKQLLYNMSVALSVAYIMNWAQLLVYEFSVVAFLKYYLPIGIFLRSFAPTRRIGGTLIALALSFLFVFPLLQLVTYGMFYNKTLGPMVTFRSFASSYLSSTSNSFSSSTSSFFSSNLSNSFWDILFAPITFISGLFKSVVFGLFFISMTIPLSVIGIAFAIGFIAPAFNVLMFVQAAKFMSRILGEEVDISQLTRMI
jgi:hypothetical protein